MRGCLCKIKSWHLAVIYFWRVDLNPCTSPLQGLYDMLSNLLVRYDDPMLPPLNKVFKVDGTVLTQKIGL